MPNLKNLKLRIKSVVSTRKITKAMKVVSASKLKKAQQTMKNSSAYYDKVNEIVGNTSNCSEDLNQTLLYGHGKNNVHLLIILSSDRGLCGPFNSNIYKAVKREVSELRAQNKKIYLFTIGTKIFSLLGQYRDIILDNIEIEGKKKITYKKAEEITDRILKMFASNEFDQCKIIYNSFESAISQKVVKKNIIPYLEDSDIKHDHQISSDEKLNQVNYEYEPEQEMILQDVLPMAIAAKIYHALLNSVTSEYAARMTAMDNANRNAEKMIKNLNLLYNRTRQAMITKELIEIISGAEAL